MAEINLGRVKGDPFTYSDFTSEQLAALKGSDGVGITAVTQTLSTEDGGTSPIEISLSDGSKSTVYVKNGSKGSDGISISSAVQSESSTQSGGKNTVTFKDSNGNNVGSVDIYNGQKGENATTTAIATTEENGLMSSTDKIKIDNIRLEVISNTEPTNQAVGDYWILDY